MSLENMKKMQSSQKVRILQIESDELKKQCAHHQL